MFLTCLGQGLFLLIWTHFQFFLIVAFWKFLFEEKLLTDPPKNLVSLCFLRIVFEVLSGVGDRHQGGIKNLVQLDSHQGYVGCPLHSVAGHRRRGEVFPDSMAILTDLGQASRAYCVCLWFFFLPASYVLPSLCRSRFLAS